MRRLERCRLLGELRSLRAVADYVRSASEMAGLDERSEYRLRLAVDEITANIITHGYQASGQTGEIFLSATLFVDRLEITIEDDAPRYDPTPSLRRSMSEIPDVEHVEGGLGLFLVSRSVDEFSYERLGDRNRNTLTVSLPQAEGPEIEQRRPVAVVACLSGASFERVRTVLARADFRTVYAQDMPSIPAVVTKLRSDLVLVDLATVKDQSIYEALVWLGSVVDCPIVAMCDRPTEEMGRNILRAGAVDYVDASAPASLFRHRLMALFEGTARRRALLRANARLQTLESLVHDYTDIILPLASALVGEPDIARLMERIVEEGMTICNADAGTFYLREEDTLRFAIMRTKSLGLALGGSTERSVPYAPLEIYDPVTGLGNHRNVATSVALMRTPINVPNIYDAKAHYDFSGPKAIDAKSGYHTLSCLTVPVVVGGEVAGVLQLINAQDPNTQELIPFDAYREQVMVSLAAEASVALQNHQLLGEREERLRLEQELSIGRQIQANFLPSRLPTIEGWDVSVHFEPARQVGGDFYDVFELPYGAIGLVMSDVCDKGVGAALFMGLVRSLLRAFAQTEWSTRTDLTGPGRTSTHLQVPNAQRELERAHRILRRGVGLTNDYLAYTHAELAMFATLFFGVLLPHRGRMAYINAGHHPFHLWGSEGLRSELRPTGPALGLMSGPSYDIAEIAIAPGELLIGYTDGVTDARNASGERFGEAQARAVISGVERGAAQSVAALVEALRRYVGEARQYDDLAMLAVSRSAE